MLRPRIVVTLSNPQSSPDPEIATVKNQRYVEALERSGAVAIPLDERVPVEDRAAALAGMDGLLISGGADLDPALYGEPSAGSRSPDALRDLVDAEAYRAATASKVPILGVCRGLQAINVFSGGRLVQHLDGHESAPYPEPNATRHGLDLVSGTRLATILGESTGLQVNSYHHQAVAPGGLAPGLRASATAAHPGAGDLVEALESTDPDRWLIAVQCHPERTESSPPVLERLWSAFVAACRQHHAAVAEDRSRPAAVRS
jgi:putative glutamine amidotransferase